jgi:translation initiation factor IF-2
MAKLRVYQLASQYEIPSKEFVTILNQHNIPVKNHMSALTDQQVAQFKESYEAEKQAKADAPEAKAKAPVKKKEEKKQEEKPKAAQAKPAEKPAAPQAKQQPAAQKPKPAQTKPQTAKKAPEGQQAPKQQGSAPQTARKPHNDGTNKPKEGNGGRGTGQQSAGGHRPAASGGAKTGRPGDKGRSQAGGRGDKPAGSHERPAGGSHHGKKPAGGESHAQDDRPNRNDSKKKKEKDNGRGNANSKFNDGKKNKNAHSAPESLKVRDHSKKEKTSRSTYKKIKAETKSEKQKNQVFEVPEVLTVGELADILDVNATEIIKILMMAGTMASINQEIDFDTASLVADELGFEIKAIKMEDVVTKILEEYDEEATGEEIKRPPVVTVMGHVDHGKTSLLDRIRKANVTAGEAGGITQHIGAYTVNIKGESITFIDTPGHEAFTAMRSRGAFMTDIAILVVAADDGVMPQTIEAINHAKAAKVPIIVAINKIDKDGANPDRVKQELTEQNLVVEEWGGDVIAVPVSAKKGTNIDELLENILLVAEVEELKADPKRAARGCVIEARVKKGKGSTASLLVQQGTLHVGDSIISGTTYGKVRTMVDDKGKRIKKAGPSKPVEISGLSDVPEAGDDFIVLPNDKEARQLAEKRLQMEKDARQAKSRMNLNDLFNRIQEGQIQDVNIIIKADVQGSVEAISQSLQKLNTDEIHINVIHGAVGAVNESDVMLASTSDAIIIGFNVRPDKNALAAAETEEVDIRLYRVIYDAINDVKQAMEGMLKPEFVEKTTGNAEVREVFRIPGGIMVAGSYVTDGKIGRNDEVRVIRDGIVIFAGKLASLRRFKDDVKEVGSGYECGIGIDKYNDIKVGDVIETFVMEAVSREL